MVFPETFFNFIKSNKEKSIFYSRGLRFQCTGCGDCCRIPGGLVEVLPEEINQIAQYLHLSVSEMKRQYFLRDVNRWLMAENEDGGCIFLQGNACRVYPVRPMQCRTFPFWPENVQSLRTWESLKSFCPGIDQGEWYSAQEIREQVEIQKMHDRKLSQFKFPNEKKVHHMPQNEITNEK